ncbi:MAG: response regulator [bacterium]|nr:response regulator [bacterium]
MTDPARTRVLVVDDEPSIRSSLAGFLDDYDYQVAVAESAEQALELIRRVSFDVAVVDLRLPGVSGDALILQAHVMCPAMRFLIHTGSVGYGLAEELWRIGVRPEDVLLKPLPDLAVVVAGIENLMRREEADG